jgi:hypothetical protein
MKNRLLIFLAGMFSTISVIAQTTFVSERLVKMWETTAELKVPECVCYDAGRNVIYVSNVAGSPTDKDGIGFISRISPEGTVLVAEWVSGLNAPKGMAIEGNFLYVSDINRVVVIDIIRGNIARSIEIPQATFLNDVVADKNGDIYVSDSRKNAIYLVKDGKYEVFAQSDRLKGPNGLYIESGKLLAGLEDRIVSIDLRTRRISDYILNTGSIDGLVPDGKGNYLISDWLGHIHLVNPKKEKVQLLDTTPDKINAADIDYVISKKMLLVPTFGNNKVVAYELK